MRECVDNQTWKKTMNSCLQKFERKEIPGKVRDIKLNKYYKKFTILTIANGFGCISSSIAVNSSILGQNLQLSIDKTGFEHIILFSTIIPEIFGQKFPHAVHACMQVFPRLGHVRRRPVYGSWLSHQIFRLRVLAHPCNPATWRSRS